MRPIIILILIAFTSCNSENIDADKKELPSNSTASSESTGSSYNTNPSTNTSGSQNIRIAYYSLDTLKLNFKYYTDQDKIVSQKQLQFQREIERRTSALQSFVQQKEQEAAKGALSENQLLEIQQQIQKKQQAILQYEQSQAAQIEKEMALQLEKIDRKIELVGKRFSELNQIDILISSGRGGQFNYIHPRYNVTQEFIQFLNDNEKDF